MKNILEKLKKSVLIYVILYAIVFIIGNLILNAFNMQFRETIYFVSLIFIAIGTIIGIIQLLCKIKNQSIKLTLITLFIVTLIPCFLYTFVLGIFAYKPEHIVIKDNKKMVAYVSGFMDTYVEYYDYKNYLVVGNMAINIMLKVRHIMMKMEKFLELKIVICSVGGKNEFRRIKKRL